MPRPATTVSRIARRPVRGEVAVWPFGTSAPSPPVPRTRAGTGGPASSSDIRTVTAAPTTLPQASRASGAARRVRRRRWCPARRSPCTTRRRPPCLVRPPRPGPAPAPPPATPGNAVSSSHTATPAPRARASSRLRARARRDTRLVRALRTARDRLRGTTRWERSRTAPVADTGGIQAPATPPRSGHVHRSQIASCWGVGGPDPAHSPTRHAVPRQPAEPRAACG